MRPSNIPREVAYVTFESREDAESALDSFDGVRFSTSDASPC